MMASQAAALRPPLSGSYISDGQYVYDTASRILGVLLNCIRKIYMSMLERAMADEIVRQPGGGLSAHSFSARDFPGGFINFLLNLSIKRIPNTHPTSPSNRSRHCGQPITCCSTRCWSRLEISFMAYRSSSLMDRCFMHPMIACFIRKWLRMKAGGMEGSGTKHRLIHAQVVVAGILKARRGMEWRRIDCTTNCCGARCGC